MLSRALQAASVEGPPPPPPPYAFIGYSGMGDSGTTGQATTVAASGFSATFSVPTITPTVSYGIYRSYSGYASAYCYANSNVGYTIIDFGGEYWQITKVVHSITTGAFRWNYRIPGSVVITGLTASGWQTLYSGSVSGANYMSWVCTNPQAVTQLKFSVTSTQIPDGYMYIGQLKPWGYQVS